MSGQPDDVERGWRVHGALDSWTGKVDTKASIALAIEAAVLGFAISLSDKDRVYFDLTGCAAGWYYAGLGLTLVSTALALTVVVPQLRRWQSRRGSDAWKSNAIYFGHLRHWEPKALVTHLRSARLESEELAQQLVTMSQIAWRKHSLLQVSLVALALGVVCFLIAAVAA